MLLASAGSRRQSRAPAPPRLAPRDAPATRHYPAPEFPRLLDRVRSAEIAGPARHDQVSQTARRHFAASTATPRNTRHALAPARECRYFETMAPSAVRSRRTTPATVPTTIAPSACRSRLVHN